MGVTMSRRALHQMRAVLERESGAHAALLLREIGFAAGEQLYDEFAGFAKEHYRVDRPQALDTQFLGEALSRFCTAEGWGSMTLSELGASVLAVDSADWAEAEPRGTAFPSCHFSSGMLADFFTRLGGAPAAVLEVECRSKGDSRCRFLVGSPEVLTYAYERMTQGAAYSEALP